MKERTKIDISRESRRGHDQFAPISRHRTNAMKLASILALISIVAGSARPGLAADLVITEYPVIADHTIAFDEVVVDLERMFKLSRWYPAKTWRGQNTFVEGKILPYTETGDFKNAAKTRMFPGAIKASLMCFDKTARAWKEKAWGSYAVNMGLLGDGSVEIVRVAKPSYWDATQHSRSRLEPSSGNGQWAGTLVDARVCENTRCYATASLHFNSFDMPPVEKAHELIKAVSSEAWKTAAKDFFKYIVPAAAGGAAAGVFTVGTAVASVLVAWVAWELTKALQQALFAQQAAITQIMAEDNLAPGVRNVLKAEHTFPAEKFWIRGQDLNGYEWLYGAFYEDGAKITVPLNYSIAPQNARCYERTETYTTDPAAEPTDPGGGTQLRDGEQPTDEKSIADGDFVITSSDVYAGASEELEVEAEDPGEASWHWEEEEMSVAPFTPDTVEAAQ